MSPTAVCNVIHLFSSSLKNETRSVIDDLVSFLPQQAVLSTLISMDEKSVFHHINNGKDVVVCRKDKKGLDVRLSFKLARYLKLQKANILHIHDLSLLAPSVLAAKLAGIASVFTLHELPEQKLSPVWLNLNKKIIFSSQYMQKHVAREHHLSEKKISVIYDGFNIEKAKRETNKENIDNLKQKLGIEENSLVIGNLGGLLADQDQASLFKTFRKMIKKNVNATLILVGDGPLKKELEELAIEFGIADRVKIILVDEDATSLMDLFDVLVITANVEDYHRHILEGMAAGKTIIATKIGIHTELVTEDMGFLVPCGFPERTESALMRLYANRELIQKMGEKARQRLVEHFSMDKMAIDHSFLYRSLVKR
jgi:glycosyltransferase involved in cell wall biosynthesis